MRTRQRLLGMKKWVLEELCAGRKLKAPNASLDITKDTWQEPTCFLAWHPTHPDSTGRFTLDPVSICPSVTIMPNPSKGKFMEEKRFDRYNKISRPDELGQTLAMSILFSIYEPGTRLPGFIDSAQSDAGLDMPLLQEATEEGLFALTDWMDDCRDKLIAQKHIRGTDLFLDEESVTYSLYTDQNYVVDKRPVYYGFVNCEFNCYAEGINHQVEDLLR